MNIVRYAAMTSDLVFIYRVITPLMLVFSYGKHEARRLNISLSRRGHWCTRTEIISKHLGNYYQFIADDRYQHKYKECSSVVSFVFRIV